MYILNCMLYPPTPPIGRGQRCVRTKKKSVGGGLSWCFYPLGPLVKHPSSTPQAPPKHTPSTLQAPLKPYPPPGSSFRSSWAPFLELRCQVLCEYGFNSIFFTFFQNFQQNYARFSTNSLSSDLDFCNTLQ